jgi:CheY-like chemotaxis protein
MAKPLKSLVVDAGVHVAESRAEILEFDGHEVALAQSGRQAVRYLKDQAFDIAFLDVVMPEMDGVDCLRKITCARSTSRGPRPRSSW